MSPDLREHFDDLLLSWPLLRLKRKLDPEVWYQFVMSDDIARSRRQAIKDRSLEFEIRYGDGRYEQRKLQLDEYLAKLEGDARVDLEAVYRALLKARRAKAQFVQALNKMAWRR